MTDLIIQQLGPKGDGVHLGQNGRVFVERTVPGDRVKGRIRRDEMGIWRAEKVEVVEPSDYRQTPPCVHYEHCGNCSLQHVNENFYRSWKTEMVKEAFRKQGLRPWKWLPPIFIGGGNRRRVNFAAFKKHGKVILGYYRRRSQQISNIDSCLIADPKLLALRPALEPYLRAILMEQERTEIFLQEIGDAIDLLITGPVGAKGKVDAVVREASVKLLKTVPIARIGWRPRERDGITLIVAKAPLTANFGPLKVNIPPDSFMQPTLEGERALVDAVMTALPAKGRFADLFSGCGTFSGPMLAKGSVDAYESVIASVQAMTKAGNSFPLRAFRRDLLKYPLAPNEINRYTAIVFDPPRGGCEEQAYEMAESKVRTLIGVSCNPATFSRDARILCEGGYRLQTLQVVDQFLWSHHVEMVGVFSR